LPESLCRQDGPIARFLRKRIAELHAMEGSCASAPGGDVLFAEALLATGGALTVQGPFPRNRILQVAENFGGNWLGRLRSVLERATRCEPVSCAKDAGEEAQSEYANYVLLGSAMLRVRRIHGRLRAVVLWDESDVNHCKRGGTAHFVSRTPAVALSLLKTPTGC
jgi:hypothetical protein